MVHFRQRNEKAICTILYYQTENGRIWRFWKGKDRKQENSRKMPERRQLSRPQQSLLLSVAMATPVFLERKKLTSTYMYYMYIYVSHIYVLLIVCK